MSGSLKKETGSGITDTDLKQWPGRGNGKYLKAGTKAYTEEVGFSALQHKQDREMGWEKWKGILPVAECVKI